jgi:hypothetical protein
MKILGTAGVFPWADQWCYIPKSCDDSSTSYRSTTRDGECWTDLRVTQVELCRSLHCCPRSAPSLGVEPFVISLENESMVCKNSLRVCSYYHPQSFVFHPSLPEKNYDDHISVAVIKYNPINIILWHHHVDMCTTDWKSQTLILVTNSSWVLANLSYNKSRLSIYVKL